MAFRFKTLAKWALRIAARHGWDGFAARLLANQIQPIPGIQRPHKPRYRILVLNLNKSGFLEDIEASFKHADDIELVSWPTYALTSFSAALLSPSLTNKNYVTTDASIEKNKQSYRSFLLFAWNAVTRRIPIDAVVTANFGYYQQREFAAALREAGVPFIALHKENVKSPGRLQYWQPIYNARGRFEGNKILVYSETEKRLQLSAGVAHPGSIVVTGMPRLDRIHEMRRSGAMIIGRHQPKQVLFFAFWRREKLTSTDRVSTDRLRTETDDTWTQRNWNTLCDETYRVLIELARSRPDIRVVMKTKRQSVRLEEILKTLGETASDLPQNFVVVKGGNPIELLAQSHVIVGFNSTALLEALAAGKPVVVPDFAEARFQEMQDLIIDLGEAVNKASSPLELLKLVKNYIDNAAQPPTELSAVAAASLDAWVGNSDGDAGQRVLAVVRDELELAKHQRSPNFTADSGNFNSRHTALFNQ